MTGIEGGVAPCKGRGTVCFKTPHPRDPSQLVAWKRENVAYIPSSPVNLISDSLCAEKGLFFDYKLDAIVDRNEEPLATVQLKAGLRCLITSGPPGTESEPTIP